MPITPDNNSIIPVDPTLTPSGSIAVLARFLPDDQARPVPLGDDENPYTSFRVTSDQLSLSLAAKLGVGGLFNSNTSYNSRAFYYDATAFTDKYATGSLDGKVIYATRWGVGLRVNLLAWDFKTDLAVNVGAIGAAVQLGAAKARYEIVGLGLGLDGLEIVLSDLPSMADFDYNAFIKLENVVIKNLAKYIKANRDKLKPVPIGVALARQIDTVDDARSIHYAMRRIYNRRSLADALTSLGGTLDPALVRLVYAQIVGNIPDTDRPTPDDAREAERWLQV